MKHYNWCRKITALTYFKAGKKKQGDANQDIFGGRALLVWLRLSQRKTVHSLPLDYKLGFTAVFVLLPGLKWHHDGHTTGNSLLTFILYPFLPDIRTLQHKYIFSHYILTWVDAFMQCVIYKQLCKQGGGSFYRPTSSRAKELSWKIWRSQTCRFSLFCFWTWNLVSSVRASVTNTIAGNPSQTQD